jgi:general secretion pathway protein F
VAAFEYSALDAAGKVRKGVLEGDSPRSIRQQLRERGWVPMDLEEVSEREARRSSSSFSLRRGLSAVDLALVTRQLSTLLRSGMPLEEVLRACAEQTEKGRIKSMLLGVRSRVMEGRSLSIGLEDFPNAFSDFYRSTVDAGEQSGHLDVVLEKLADYTENRQIMRQKITLALVYPILLTLVAILVVAGLLAYVVPQVVQVFEHIGQELPALTRGLIAFSDFLQANGITIAIGTLLVLVAGVVALRRPGPRRFYHGLLLRLPLVGRVVRSTNAASFARTLSILAASGVPVLDAMRISGQVVGNLPMRDVVAEASARVREGESIHEALRRGGHFPPMTIHLIASGESSGQLEQMLQRAAENQEQEVQGLVATVLGLFEPLMILSMGGVVLVIVLAILLPIFEMNQLVQ